MGDGDYTTALNNKHAKIIKDLQELQAVETYLFTKIQEAASGNQENEEQKKISTHIEKLARTRTTLLKELQNLYTSANDNVNEASSILGNQTIMAQQLNEEIKKSKLKEKRLIAEKNNKQRLAQIGEYEYSKNTEHKTILKIIVYGSFFVLFFIFLNAKEILPQFLTKIFVVVILLQIIKKMYWNFKRDNIDYSKFRFPKKNKVVFDKQTENTFNLNDLFGVECKDKSLENEVLTPPNQKISEHSHSEGNFNLDNSGYKTHSHSPPDDPSKPEEQHQHRVRVGGAEETAQEDESEGFALLNQNGCKSCKNIFPSNNLTNSTFKNTSLKYSTVN